jgi:hypothetical protein
MAVIPAMLGYLIFKSETVANTQTTAIIAANTALCMVGASGLSAAISSGSTLSAVTTGLDITLGAGAGIVNTVPEIAQDHPEFTKYYNYATVVYTLGRLGYSGYQNVKAKWPKSSAVETVVIDEQLLSELNLLTNSDDAVKAFVTTNIDRLVQNPNTIWEITYDAVRGRVWERVRAMTDLKGWQFIGGQNQKLLDFFYDERGIIMQQKSIRATVTESTLNSYNSSFKTIIDNLAEVKRSGIYMLQDGKTINVSDAMLDIVVQKGLNTELLKPLIDHGASRNITVNIVVK